MRGKNLKTRGRTQKDFLLRVKIRRGFPLRKWTVALNHLKYMVCGFIGALLPL